MNASTHRTWIFGSLTMAFLTWAAADLSTPKPETVTNPGLHTVALHDVSAADIRRGIRGLKSADKQAVNLLAVYYPKSDDHNLYIRRGIRGVKGGIANTAIVTERPAWIASKPAKWIRRGIRS